MIALIFGRVLGFLKNIPWQVWAIGGLILAAWLAVGWHGRQVRTAIRDADRGGYIRAMSEVVTAQAEAERLARANVTRIERNQATITREVQTGHGQAILHTRDRATALRVWRPAAPTDRGPPGRADLPRLPGPAGRIAPAADGEGLSRSVAIDALEQCELNTATLISLQRWVRDQQAAFPPTD